MLLTKLAATATGRLTRIIAGLLIIALGLFVIGGVVGIGVAAIGLAPFFAGVFNVCLIAPILRAPFSGRVASNS